MSSKDTLKKKSSNKSKVKSVVGPPKDQKTTPQKKTVRKSSGKNAKKTSTKKSLTVDLTIYNTLKKMIKDMTEKLGGRITFSMIIQSLLNDHYDLQNVRQELEDIKLEMDETQTYLKDMLKLALTNKQTTPQFIPVPVNSLNTQNLTQSIPPPPPSHPSSLHSHQPVPHNKITNYVPPDTGNLKKDYVAEIKQIFTGAFMKPSEVAHVTKPKYLNSDINEIDENAPIPDINKVSTAKRYPRRDETYVDV